MSNDSYRIYIKTSPFSFVQNFFTDSSKYFLIQIHRHELLMKAFLPPTGFNVKSNYECMIIIKYRYATSYASNSNLLLIKTNIFNWNVTFSYETTTNLL